jgi:hypothetical protein
MSAVNFESVKNYNPHLQKKYWSGSIDPERYMWIEYMPRLHEYQISISEFRRIWFTNRLARRPTLEAAKLFVWSYLNPMNRTMQWEGVAYFPMRQLSLFPELAIYEEEPEEEEIG